MKLNPDLVRDILLTVEEIVDFETSFEYDENDDQLCKNKYKKLKRYNNDEIMYHFHQCYFGEYFYEFKNFDDNTINIEDLSLKGHEFLANIRSDIVWNKTKELASKFSISSLNGVTCSRRLKLL